MSINPNATHTQVANPYPSQPHSERVQQIVDQALARLKERSSVCFHKVAHHIEFPVAESEVA